MQSTARQTRENRTITVDFQNEAIYFQLLGDGNAFVELVVAFTDIEQPLTGRNLIKPTDLFPK